MSNYEAPADWVPATLTADQVREVNARNAVECELIDEALGRVLGRVAERGWADDIDVVFTTDHGELQGDFGLLFKGPYHVDALMRLPLVWRPAPRPAAAAGGGDPAGRAGRPGPDLLRHRRARRRRRGCRARRSRSTTPTPTRRGFERVLTEWDSELFGVGVHLRTIMRDRWVCTAYLPGHRPRRHRGRALRPGGRPAPAAQPVGRPGAARAVRDDLVADLWDHQPPARRPRWPWKRRSEAAWPGAVTTWATGRCSRGDGLEAGCARR